MKLTQTQLTPTKRVCFRLKEAREAKGISQSDMAQKIRMSREHIQALESCAFETLPFTTLYQKNFIRSYLKALGIAPQDFVNQFVCEEVVSKKQAIPANVQQKMHSHSFHNMPRLVKTACIALICVGCVGYLVMQVKHIVDPPDLAIYTPENGTVTKEGTAIVRGKTDPGVEIQINGTSVMHKEDGFFETNIPLSDGVNTIIFSAKKKHGKTTEEIRHIVYKKNQELSFIPHP